LPISGQSFDHVGTGYGFHRLLISHWAFFFSSLAEVFALAEQVFGAGKLVVQDSDQGKKHFRRNVFVDANVVIQLQYVFRYENFVKKLRDLLLILVAGLKCLCTIVLTLSKAMLWLLGQWQQLPTLRKWNIAENHTHVFLSDVSF